MPNCKSEKNKKPFGASSGAQTYKHAHLCWSFAIDQPACMLAQSFPIATKGVYSSPVVWLTCYMCCEGVTCVAASLFIGRSLGLLIVFLFF